MLLFLGGLNGAIKSDLTPLYSAHFALHSAHIALFFQQEKKFQLKKTEKQCKMFAAQ